jgi:hypothetical protein
LTCNIENVFDSEEYDVIVDNSVEDLCSNPLAQTTIHVIVSAGTPPSPNSEGVVNINNDGTTTGIKTVYNDIPAVPVDDTVSDGTCSAFDDGEELVFQYTSTNGGVLYFDTIGSNFNTILEVFESDGTTLVGCHNDIEVMVNNLSRLDLGCQSTGQLYYLIVSFDSWSGDPWQPSHEVNINVYDFYPTSAPTSLSPANGASDIFTNSSLTIEFDAQLDTTTGTISLSGNQGYSASYNLSSSPSEIEFSRANSRITINPSTDFDYNEQITVTLTGLEFTCGGSVADPTWQFTTVATDPCTSPTTYNYNPASGLPLAVGTVSGDNNSATISVSDNISVCDIRVTLNANMIDPGVNAMILESPDGTQVELKEADWGYYSITDWTDITFDDGGAPIAYGTLANQTFQPFETLDTFDGINAMGDWKIILTDLLPAMEPDAEITAFTLTIDGV